MGAPRTARGGSALVAAVIAGGLSAAVFGLALSYADTPFIFLVYLTNVPLFMAGLGGGTLSALVAGLAATAGLYFAEPSNYAFVYVFVFAVPGILLTTLALRYRMGQDQKIYWYPEGRLLTAAAVYPCVIFIVVAIFLSSSQGGLLALTTSSFKDIADHVSKNVGADQAVSIHEWMIQLAEIAPGVIGATWIIVMVLDMAFAQTILRQQKLNLRETFSLRGLHLPNILIYGVAIFGVAGLIASFLLWANISYVCKNVCINLGLPFFFVGLSVVHAWAATTRVPIILLTVFYIILVSLIWLSVLVVLVGVLDQWLDFRRHLAKVKKPS